MRTAPLLLLACITLAATHARAQDVPINDQARAHFQAGVNFLQDPDGARYEEAYREFSAAYQSSPSWKILGNLGIAAMKLERDGEAIDAFEKYLAGGGSSLAEDERQQFQRDLATLKAGVVRVAISVNHPGATILDERLPVSGSPVRNTYAPNGQSLQVGVRAGHHRMTARLQGFEDQVWEFDAVSGSSPTHDFVLAAPVARTERPVGPASGTRPTPTGVYIGLGTTGAFAVGAGVVGVLALKRKSKFDSENDGTNPAHAESLRSSVKTLNLVTDALIGAAVVSAGVVTYLYLSRPNAEADTSAGWLRVQPRVGYGTGALELEGAF